MALLFRFRHHDFPASYLRPQQRGKNPYEKVINQAFFYVINWITPNGLTNFTAFFSHKFTVTKMKIPTYNSRYNIKGMRHIKEQLLRMKNENILYIKKQKIKTKKRMSIGVEEKRSSSDLVKFILTGLRRIPSYPLTEQNRPNPDKTLDNSYHSDRYCQVIQPPTNQVSHP